MRGRLSLTPTLAGSVLWIARGLWIVSAAFGAFVDIAALPVYYQHALSLHDHQLGVTAHPAEWRAGLHALGLTPALYAGFETASQIVLSAAMFLIGVVIFLRKSNEWIGLFISIVLVSFGLVSSNTAPVGFPDWFNAVANAYSNIAYLSFFVIPLVFPNGRFVPRWSGWAVAFVVITAIGGSIAPHSALDSSTWPAALSAPLSVLAAATILASPIYRYRRVSDAAQREQTKWVLFTVVLAIAIFVLMGSAVPAVPGIMARPVQAVLVRLTTGIAVGLAFLLVPVGFAIAILRYRLWDIDVLINRTLVYGSLTATLAGLYIGAVIALQALFRAVAGQHSDLAIAIATLAVAALFNPWRHRLQSFIDRRFYRRKYDATRALSAFNGRLRDEVDLDQLSVDMLGVLQETLQPATASLWLRNTSNVEGRP